ncbi:aminopeptidase [Flavobacterium ponti]|uniref:Aminopeptidase n=1 Tax=Flavobacterium ponti TaxID=665133 RepID=A0ABV9P335_9FLAO
MKLFRFILLFLLLQSNVWAQHKINLNVKVDTEKHLLYVQQEIMYVNNTSDTLKTILLNDWNNAFSSKNSALARRFSDEFSRVFHLAKEEDRGFTKINSIVDGNYNQLTWEDFDNRVDVKKITLTEPILPNSQHKILFNYIVKIPNEKFTKYGFDNNGNLYLKDWFLNIPRYENKKFIIQSNENLDDISNALSDYKIEIAFPKNYEVFSDLKQTEVFEDLSNKKYTLTANGRQTVSLVFEPIESISYKNYKNENVEVVSDFEDKRLSEIQVALVIDKVTKYVTNEIGVPKENKILVSNDDYDKNPFYGVNQLPSFINPFPDEFIFEVRFLKTYLNNLLKENIQINHRKDHWIEEGIQQYVLMNYIDYHYPKFKMMGSLSKIKILKGYNILSTDFNDQFYYVYLLMARKNLDQPLGSDKNSLIKFNEQIAGKYRAGLSLRYLDAYLENNIVSKSIREFLDMNKNVQTSRYDFEFILKQNTAKDIDWFFDTVINKRDLIDYKFGPIKKQKETISVSIKNKTLTNVPIPLYGLSNDTIVYKKWLTNIKTDTTIVIPRNNIDKLVLNYKTEVPEFNLRNNWHSLNGFLFNNRPLKFTFFKDLENPYYNQVFYVPTAEYNLYDGIKVGMKINNRSVLNKPFTFDLSPEYSSNTQKIVGSISGMVNQNVREGRLYNIRYAMSASTSHYAPEALYTRIIPTIQFRFRDKNFRYNKNEYIQLSQYYVNREKSAFTTDANTDNYSVFNARYYNIQSEMTKYYSFHTDLQIANSFGKLAAEIEYRKLFEDNRRINLRFYVGTFMYRSTNSDFFSFGVDRPTDYLFNYNLLGRSESSGLFSQQFVMSEGGFKSKFETRYANQWISTINGSFNIWNWIEVYGDVGLFKNKSIQPKFIYDSGIRLNLVPDYFELYFPVQSSNGFELNQDNYGQKIRFVVTLSPKTLISLFTRKWF